MNSKVTIEHLDHSWFGMAASALSDPDVNKWMYNEWRSSDVNERTVAVAAVNKRNSLWIVKCEGEAYGVAALSGINAGDATAIMWYLRFANVPRRPGAMAKGVALVARHGFDVHGLNSVSASIHADNVPSARLLEAVGFKRAGIMREGFLRDDGFVDRIVYDLLRSDEILCDLTS